MSERASLGGLALALVLSGVVGAAVPDPTRPAIGASAASDSPSSAPTSAPVLQSTLVSPTQRSAIIDGRRVRLGDTLGDARIVAIGAGWVRLQGPAGTSELRLSYSKSTPPVNR